MKWRSRNIIIWELLNTFFEIQRGRTENDPSLVETEKTAANNTWIENVHFTHILRTMRSDHQHHSLQLRLSFHSLSGKWQIWICFLIKGWCLSSWGTPPQPHSLTVHSVQWGMHCFLQWAISSRHLSEPSCSVIKAVPGNNVTSLSVSPWWLTLGLIVLNSLTEPSSVVTRVTQLSET